MIDQSFTFFYHRRTVSKNVYKPKIPFSAYKLFLLLIVYCQMNIFKKCLDTSQKRERDNYLLFIWFRL